MGGSYGHILAIGTGLESVVVAIGQDPAYVAEFGDTVAIFSEAATGDPSSRATEISQLVDGDIVGFAVVDDDVLACVLCRAGETVAEVMVPAIEEFAGISEDELELMAEMMGEPVPGSGNVDDPSAFVFGVGRGDARRALAILGDNYGGDGPISAVERHRDLLAALQLPTAVAGWDYYQFEAETDGFEGQAKRLSR